MIKRDILWSLGSSAGCFSSYDTIALSILPPTLIIPLPSTNGLNVLDAPFSSRFCTLLYALLIHKISAFANSSGMRGPSRPPSWFLRERICSANLPSHAVTCISFRQLVKTFGSITFPISTCDAALTALTWQRSMLCSAGLGITVWTGHCSSGSFRNLGPFTHLPVSCCTRSPLDKSSATFSSLGMCLH